MADEPIKLIYTYGVKFKIGDRGRAPSQINPAMLIRARTIGGMSALEKTHISPHFPRGRSRGVGGRWGGHVHS